MNARVRWCTPRVSMRNVNNSIRASANQFFFRAYSISANASASRRVASRREKRANYTSKPIRILPHSELLPNVVTTTYSRSLLSSPSSILPRQSRVVTTTTTMTKTTRSGEARRYIRRYIAIASVCIGGRPLDGVIWGRDGGPGGPSVRISIIDSAEYSCRTILPAAASRRLYVCVCTSHV